MELNSRAELDLLANLNALDLADTTDPLLKQQAHLNHAMSYIFMYRQLIEKGHGHDYAFAAAMRAAKSLGKVPGPGTDVAILENLEPLDSPSRQRNGGSFRVMGPTGEYASMSRKGMSKYQRGLSAVLENTAEVFPMQLHKARNSVNACQPSKARKVTSAPGKDRAKPRASMLDAIKGADLSSSESEEESSENRNPEIELKWDF